MSSNIHSNINPTANINQASSQGRNSGRAYNGSGALNSITQIYGTNNLGTAPQNQNAQNSNHHHHMLKMIKKSQIDTTNAPQNNSNNTNARQSRNHQLQGSLTTTANLQQNSILNQALQNVLVANQLAGGDQNMLSEAINNGMHHQATAGIAQSPTKYSTGNRPQSNFASKNNQQSNYQQYYETQPLPGAQNRSSSGSNANQIKSSSLNKRTSGSQQKQQPQHREASNSGRRLLPASSGTSNMAVGMPSQFQQQTPTQNTIQIQNLVQMFKQQNGHILPPMSTKGQQQPMTKPDIGGGVGGPKTTTNQQIKGLSPKLTNQSPGANNMLGQQRNNSNSNAAPKYSSLLGTFGNQQQTSDESNNAAAALQHQQNHSTKPPQSMLASRSRNSTMNNAQSVQDANGMLKQQFSSMRNAGGNNASSSHSRDRNAQFMSQQSPNNYSGRFASNVLLRGNNQNNQNELSGHGIMNELDPSIVAFVQSYEPAKFASKRNGVVASYAANTHQGIIRNYNEDRVSIILNIIKPKFKETAYWPRCSFFGVYDGHGGAACADYLRDQLHQLIVKHPDFPENPKKAIEGAFAEAENTFLDYAESQAASPEQGGCGQVDRSGSCAVIALIVGDMCYLANVGDSRAIMSADGGDKILLLSRDHKPEAPDETKRIEENGGRIYQNSNYIPDITPQGKGTMHLIVGPHRVFPGRLSVSRTIGDIEAKEPKYGGNPRVVVPTPDIKCFKIRNNYDFIILACDGVFEKLNNQEVVKNAWDASLIKGQNSANDSRSIHEKCGQSVDRILQYSAFKRTFDNITSVMIAFENFENTAGQPTNGQTSSKTLDQSSLPSKQLMVPVGTQLTQNPFALMADFLILHDGIAPPILMGNPQIDGPPGQHTLPMDPIVEEELIDNQETETPSYIDQTVKKSTPQKGTVVEDDYKSHSRVTNNEIVKVSSRPSSEIQKKDQASDDNAVGFRQQNASQQSLGSQKSNNRYNSSSGTGLNPIQPQQINHTSGPRASSSNFRPAAQSHSDDQQTHGLQPIPLITNKTGIPGSRQQINGAKLSSGATIQQRASVNGNTANRVVVLSQQNNDGSFPIKASPQSRGGALQDNRNPSNQSSRNTRDKLSHPNAMNMTQQHLNLSNELASILDAATKMQTSTKTGNAPVSRQQPHSNLNQKNWFSNTQQIAGISQLSQQQPTTAANAALLATYQVSSGAAANGNKKFKKTSGSRMRNSNANAF